MFVYANILEGPEDGLMPGNLGRMPAFSQKFSDCHMLLIKALMELGELKTEISAGLFDEAVRLGFMVRKRPCPVWRMEAGGLVAYGRSFGEAVCKLLIVSKYRPAVQN